MTPGDIYRLVYGKICGTAPRIYPWHFQWLVANELYRELQRILPQLRGRLLDVGCGGKPYGRWLGDRVEHVGIDIAAGPGVDVVIAPRQPWPFSDDSFNAVLCTQVLEHTGDEGWLTAEIHRVLQPDGLILISVPFIYGEHGAPLDFKRFSRYGIQALLTERFEVTAVMTQGRIGSTTGSLWLNWVDAMVSRHKALGLARAGLLPAWIVFTGIVNLLSWGIDKLDPTGRYYGNLLIAGTKRCA